MDNFETQQDITKLTQVPKCRSLVTIKEVNGCVETGIIQIVKRIQHAFGTLTTV